MRAFVVLCSLAVLVSADVKHLYDAPYNSQKVVSQGYKPHGIADTIGHYPTSSNTNQNYVNPGLSNNGQHYGVPTTSNGFVQQPSNIGFAPNNNNNRFGGESVGSLPVRTGFGGSSFGPSNSGFGGYNGDKFQSHTTLVKQTVPLVSKSSYVFSAPVDNEELQRDQTIVLPRPRQHYKVVFIKAPSTTIINSPSTGNGGNTQEKTLIYVLSDKKRIENHIDVPESENSKLTKPEVFFVKYNKPTEVVNSQIKYETVDAVNGAENGAINGVPNKVSGTTGQFQDEGANPEQAQIAQAIYQAVQLGGLQSGLKTVDQLIDAGHSVSTGGDAQPSHGSYDTVGPNGASPVSHGSSDSGINGASYPEKGYVY